MCPLKRANSARQTAPGHEYLLSAHIVSSMVHALRIGMMGFGAKLDQHVQLVGHSWTNQH